ncbi:hypothetical protein A9Q99_26615 [Gammaproteobacteria bacterium 45_16_T64]|nr:hypothetical protein A9Q99_26615 [Gammaproteobacteria bacterium 45_16_T64]
MVVIEGTASLNLVKEQLDESLSVAESSLEQYAEEPSNNRRLTQCVDLFRQLKGVMTIVNLQGAAMLVEEMESLGEYILDHQDSDQEPSLAGLSNAIMVLGHYLEYVQAKQSTLPVLLIPTINEVRSLAKKPLAPESTFFRLAKNPSRPEKTTGEPADHVKLEEIGRRLRHMYQVGMLGVFKGENVSTNVKLMQRALDRIDSLSGDVPLAKLWWLGQGVLSALGSENVEVTNSRKSLLGMIDRQIKATILQSEVALAKEAPDHVVQEAVFVTSLAEQADGVVAEILAAFEVGGSRLDGLTMQREQALMNGPSGSVIKSVVDAIKEELAHIKDSLDLGARGAHGDDEESFNRISVALVKIANTLVMLGLMDASNVLKDQAGNIANWTSIDDIDADSEEFNAVADALLYVENSIASLSPRMGGAQGVDDNEAESVAKEGMSITQLEEARRLVVGESRAGLSLAKRALTSYMESNWDGMHLNNVPVTLNTVWGGLTFLQLDRAANVMKSCEDFIRGRLINDRANEPDEHLMETLADAITSIDYYLESIESNKPIGDGVLDVAEESMDELGFPGVAA